MGPFMCHFNAHSSQSCFQNGHGVSDLNVSVSQTVQLSVPGRSFYSKGNKLLPKPVAKLPTTDITGDIMDQHPRYSDGPVIVWVLFPFSMRSLPDRPDWPRSPRAVRCRLTGCPMEIPQQADFRYYCSDSRATEPPKVTLWQHPACADRPFLECLGPVAHLRYLEWDQGERREQLQGLRALIFTPT